MPDHALPIEPPYVFISYASRDRDRVRRVLDVLEAAGVRVWFDQRAIDGGTSYGLEIAQGIQHAHALVLMGSAASLASRNVRQEIHLAWHYGRPYLPLMLERATFPEEIIYWLEGAQRIDVLDHPEQEWLPRVLRALSRFGITPGGSVTIAPPTSTPRSHAVAHEVATNLPVPATNFVGRVDELAAVGELLRSNRLVTIAGAGGAGKTRLAIEAGRDQLGRFTDGVWLVELASHSEPALVPQAVADVFGVREQPGKELHEVLEAALAQREALLVLDNCEHLVASCAALATRLLAACPALKLLVTTREPLNVAGEVIYRVPTMSLPDTLEHVTVESAGASDAVRLFVDRAALAKPGFALGESNATTVSRICRSLDGIPLALELAAARVKVLSLEQIEARLADRFRLLTGGSRGALPHHQTLRQAIDWSYELLDESQRLLFRRMAVFAGGCILDQAEAVCSGDGIDAFDVLDLIAQLVDKSLLVAEDQRDTVRYRMLESVREYADEKQRALDDADALAERHATAFVQLAGEGSENLRGPHQLFWMRRLSDELDNLRNALDWTLRQRPALALRLAASLRWFWEMRSLLSEGRRWLDAALTVDGDARTLAEVRNGAGKFALLLGDFERAERCFMETHTRLTELDDLVAVDTLYHLSSIAIHQGDVARARAHLDACLAQLEEQHQPWWSAAVLLNLAITYGVAEDFAQAQALLARALELCRLVGDQWLTSICLSNLAMAAGLQGDLDRQVTYLHEGIDVFASIGDTVGVTDCLWGLGAAALRRGQPATAARLFGASQALGESVGAPVLTINLDADDHDVRELRRLLDEETFQAAWTAGRAMLPHEALAEAHLAAAQCQR